MSAPMTAGEAADAYLKDDQAWVAAEDMRGFREKTRDWFLQHWPAGGAVTGEQVFDAFNAGQYAWEAAAPAIQIMWDRAAARLSAPPVTFDPEAVAREIVDACYICADLRTRPKKVAAILRRHAAAPAVAQWVRRPAAEGGTLVVPEGGLYWCRIGTTPDAGTAHYLTAGHVVQDAWSAIRRIDTSEPTTWIERTATAGGWTDSDVAACVGQRRVVSINEGQRGYLCDWTAYDAATIAARFNAAQVTAYYILPPVEVQHA